MKVDVVVVLPAFGNEVTIEEELLFSFFCLFRNPSGGIRRGAQEKRLPGHHFSWTCLSGPSQV